MNDFGGDLDYTGWKPSDIDITWDRTVTAVTADSTTIATKRFFPRNILTPPSVCSVYSVVTRP